MENNKILIGVQFTDVDENSKYRHYNIELYVLRDLPMYQLLEGITYGLKKLASGESQDREIYERCRTICSDCISQSASGFDGRKYMTHVTFTSFNDLKAEKLVKGGERTAFYLDNLTKPLCDLGFITSSRIIFDTTGSFVPKGKLDTSNIVEAFDPRRSSDIFFPEYNISTRQLYQFDTKPVDIIDPTEPPKKPNNSLFFMLLPSLLTVGILIMVRILLMNSNPRTGLTMIALSAAMGITAAVTTVINYNRQKKEYAEDLEDWRNQYQNYIDDLFIKIKDRQQKDAVKLDELYPDMLTLINPNARGIYSLNENLYSRSPQDDDFLTFRLGVSDRVESMFPIKGAEKEVVFSEASFNILSDASDNETLKVYLNEETEESGIIAENLCRLPSVIADRYKYMRIAPLLCSLKDKSAIGLVDRNIDSSYSLAKYFITRMIFELCYYHSPEDLQFVMFFENKKQWTEIENTINMYKFMPHFRGLFADKSQFIFDTESAGLVMSSLLTMMGRRKASQQEGRAGGALPRIICIVFEEHGMKEHAFAEYLPDVPKDTEKPQNSLGLTFVFAKKYKEYLPAYCDDVVDFDHEDCTITPHFDSNRQKRFFYTQDMSENKSLHIQNFTTNTARAFRFFSSVYYAQIAQNGKVPSAVSAFEILNKGGDALTDVVKKNWGIDGQRSGPSVTESLKVAIGKTETGTAFLDLHEKGDGPHMLVAGTTGSGKTETVITFLLGLCMQFSPDELNLLLVDMKGGGFTKRIGHLPHVVGAVTDVDGDENGTGAEYMLGRFLYAMKAEIKRRKLLFNKLYVDSIDAYIAACKDIDSYLEQKKISGIEADEIRETAKKDPLSHLILVVDEFTELKRFSTENSELDFMGEITTIARVGRSLGFHIILISQNIEGAITEDIRVNSRARLCLKVATRQASKDMIGTELAASPYMPGNGRAYLLVGTGSKFEYFQSGYSGAGTLEEVPVEITLASKTGAYTAFYRSDRDNAKLIEKKIRMKKEGSSKTQLQAINDAICAVYQENQNSIGTPHMVFRAPLPSRIALDKKGNVVDVSAVKGGK